MATNYGKYPQKLHLIMTKCVKVPTNSAEDKVYEFTYVDTDDINSVKNLHDKTVVLYELAEIGHIVEDPNYGMEIVKNFSKESDDAKI